jgi:hypothetical protein
MCTYTTIRSEIDGSAKGPGSSWFHVTDATVYFDHPVHAMAEHTLNIDFANPASGPSARVAIELTETSAQELLVAIQGALASATLSGISGRAPGPDAQQDDQVHAEFEAGHRQ